MPYSVLIFAYRKPGTTPEQFRAHYEGTHVPLVRELTGANFPLSHTRHYLHRTERQAEGNTARNPGTPATVLIGAQEEFDYDAFAELAFEDEAAFQAFFALTQQPENAERIAADEELFLDRARMTVVLKADTTVTERS
ncbi:putative dimeric alpha-beta barrel [Rosellinia necatrix]|uniref:Putative dimeric alpha-beta barrel n=1 Tax=Rosellinia necatrix TaxID=77044 RepID=A0A1W2TRM9_ROSNE|nr:putative dimeric alpha-beta barrel [Rosellinia necatrix]